MSSSFRIGFAAAAAYLCAVACGSDSSAPVDGGPSSAQPSCAGQGPTCGAGGKSDCCASTSVPAGSFILGFTSEDFGPPDKGYGLSNAHASVSAFELDTYEVTVGRFRAFVNAFEGSPSNDAGASLHIAGSGWQPAWPLARDRNALVGNVQSCNGGTWTSTADANESLPMTCINWYELFAFCAWDGARIPTMTERMYVAYGGAETRFYPWSPPTDGGDDDADINPSIAVYSPEGGAPAGPERVGAHPTGNGKWGESDLGGNVEEWVLDQYPPLPYPSAPPGCVDCAVLDASVTSRTIQGGSFADPADFLTSFRITGADPTERKATRGGRCAR